MAEPLLTPEAAAEMLGVPRARILALVRGRAIGSVRVRDVSRQPIAVRLLSA